jgi:hypothetical protein
MRGVIWFVFAVVITLALSFFLFAEFGDNGYAMVPGGGDAIFGDFSP